MCLCGSAPSVQVLPKNMSARVVNPFSLNEMRRLRDAVAARPPTFRPDPDARARVCRNLWGKASADDSRAFAAKELVLQRERAADRWGFDFLREAPRSHGPGADRYKWTRVRLGSVPAAYRMPRMTLPLPPAATPAGEAPLQILETARATVPCVAMPTLPDTITLTPATVTPSLSSPDMTSPTTTTTISNNNNKNPAPPKRQTTING